MDRGRARSVQSLLLSGRNRVHPRPVALGRELPPMVVRALRAPILCGLLLVAGGQTYGAAPSDGLAGISAEHVSILRSLHQQFVDLDAWKNTQFKKSARARA